MQDNNSKQEWEKIAETQSDHELSQGHKFWLYSYRIGIAGSFVALGIFIIERMAGTNVQIWEYTDGQLLNAGVGLIFAFIFSMFIYGFYLTDYSIKSRAFIFAVAVMFPLFAEVSQTMHRGEETQKANSQSSPEFRAAQQTLSALTGVNPTANNAASIAAAAGEKARHEAELKACARYESATRQDKCRRYEMAKMAEADGKVQGYTASNNAAITANQGALTGMIGTIKELGNNEDHAHAMVKLFMSFGINVLWASLIMAILIIGSVEAAIAWVGDHVKNYQKAMRARGLEIGNQRKEVVKFSGGSTHAPQTDESEYSNESAPLAAFSPLADSAKQTVEEYAQKVEQGLKASPEIIAREYARADHANKQVLADMGAIGGKIGEKIDSAIAPQRFLNLMYVECRTRILNGDIQPTIKAVSYALEDVMKKHEKVVGTLPSNIRNADLNKMAEKALHKMEMERIIMKTSNGYVISSQFRDNRPAPAGIASTVKMIVNGVDLNKAKTPEEIKQAVYNTYSVIPNPVELDDADLDNVAKKIASERVQPSVSNLVQAPQMPSPLPHGTGIHNPVLGKAEAVYPLPLPVAELAELIPLNAELAERNPLNVQRKSFSETESFSENRSANQLEEMAKKLADTEEALAQKVIEQREAEAAELAERSALEASYQAKLDAEREERKRAEEAKAAAELAERKEREAAELAERKAAEERELAERERAAAELKAAVDAANKAAAELAERKEREAAELAERGSLTDEQIQIAVNVIRNALNEQHIKSLGSPSTSPLLKAAGLPTSDKSLKTLSKLACAELEKEGLVIQNPKPANGQPLYLIAKQSV